MDRRELLVSLGIASFVTPSIDVKVLDGDETAEGGACSLFIDDTVIVNNTTVVALV